MHSLCWMCRAAATIHRIERFTATAAAYAITKLNRFAVGSQSNDVPIHWPPYFLLHCSEICRSNPVWLYFFWPFRFRTKNDIKRENSAILFRFRLWLWLRAENRWSHSSFYGKVNTSRYKRRRHSGDTGKVAQILRPVRVESENELVLSRRNKFFAAFVQSILCLGTCNWNA